MLTLPCLGARLQILRDKGILVRGLTHPSPVSNSIAFSHDGDRSEESAHSQPPSFGRSRAAMRARQSRQWWQPPRREEQQDEAANNAEADPGFANFLVQWGAVPVGPTSLFKLLRNGECILLYPGGAAEVRCILDTISTATSINCALHYQLSLHSLQLSVCAVCVVKGLFGVVAQHQQDRAVHSSASRSVCRVMRLSKATESASLAHASPFAGAQGHTAQRQVRAVLVAKARVCAGGGALQRHNHPIWWHWYRGECQRCEHMLFLFVFGTKLLLKCDLDLSIMQQCKHASCACRVGMWSLCAAQGTLTDCDTSDVNTWQDGHTCNALYCALQILSADGLTALGKQLQRLQGRSTNNSNDVSGSGKRARRGVNDMGDILPPDDVRSVRHTSTLVVVNCQHMAAFVCIGSTAFQCLAEHMRVTQ